MQETSFTIIEVLSIILSSSLLTAFITAYITKYNNDKNIKVKTILKQRKRWRDKIRYFTRLVNHNYYENNFSYILPLICEFEIRLNPKDKEDNKILKNLYLLSKLKSNEEDIINEFNKRISLLLKHDWERVKSEVNLKSKNIKRKKYFKQ